jgi:hypothetical protein
LKKLKPTNKFEKKSKKKRKSPNSRILNLKIQIQTCKAKHKEGREKMNKKNGEESSETLYDWGGRQLLQSPPRTLIPCHPCYSSDSLLWLLHILQGLWWILVSNFPFVFVNCCWYMNFYFRVAILCKNKVGDVIRYL